MSFVIVGFCGICFGFSLATALFARKEIIHEIRRVADPIIPKAKLKAVSPKKIRLDDENEMDLEDFANP